VICHKSIICALSQIYNLCIVTNLSFVHCHKSIICNEVIECYKLFFCNYVHHLQTLCAILHLSTKCVQRYKNHRLFCNCRFPVNWYACSAKAREARLAAAANPTTAQVKKVQAVIFTANVAVKGPNSDPIIPPPTQRERDAINNFMELQHYSMTATTIITDPLPTTQLHDPFCSTPAPRSLSPTASTTLSIPTPIPITGADGTVICLS